MGYYHSIYSLSPEEHEAWKQRERLKGRRNMWGTALWLFALGFICPLLWIGTAITLLEIYSSEKG